MKDSPTLALEYLQDHNVLCLATSQAHQPWIAPVFYALHKGALVFLSAPHTRHSLAMASNARVAGSVQEDYKNWEDIKGIQLEGVVRAVDKRDTTGLIESYARKFPVTGIDAPPAISSALDKVSWFSLQPELLYFIDNSRGLGHREEIDCSILARANP